MFFEKFLCVWPATKPNQTKQQSKFLFCETKTVSKLY